MTMYGADIEHLRSLARAMNERADRLDSEVVSQLGNQLRQSSWNGADADAFRGAWSSTLVPMVTRSAQQLRDAATRLEANANDQEQTSSGDSGGASTGSGGSQGHAGTTHRGSAGAKANGKKNIDVWEIMSWITDKLGKVSGLGDVDRFAAWIKTALDLPGADVSKFLDNASLVGINAALDGSAVGKFLKGAGYVGLSMEAIETLNTVFNSSANPLEKATSIAKLAASVAQTSNHPVVNLAGMAAKSWIMAGEEAAKIDHTLPEGVTLLEAIAGKQELSDNPVVAAAEVVNGGAQHFWKATCKVFGGVFG